MVGSDVSILSMLISAGSNGHGNELNYADQKPNIVLIVGHKKVQVQYE